MRLETGVGCQERETARILASTNTVVVGPICKFPMQTIHGITLMATTAPIVGSFEMTSFKVLNIIFNSTKRADLS